MFLPTEVFSTVHLNFKNSFNLNGSSIGAWMNHPPPKKNHHFHLKRPTLHVSWGRASQKPAQWASSLVVTWRAETSHGCVLKNALWLGGDPNFWTQNSRWVAVSKYFFLMFIPKIWGRWTDFDEHMFQSGWFNHLPENHCFFFTKLKFCQRAKPSCLFFWTWKEVKVAEREVDWTAPNAGFVFFFFFSEAQNCHHPILLFGDDQMEVPTLKGSVGLWGGWRQLVRLDSLGGAPSVFWKFRLHYVANDFIGQVFLFDPSLREMMTLNMMMFFERVNWEVCTFCYSFTKGTGLTYFDSWFFEFSVLGFRHEIIGPMSHD